MGYQLWRDAMLQNSVSKIVIHQSLPSNLLDDFKGDFNFGAIVPMPVEVQILAEHENNLFDPIKENQPEYIKALSVVQDKFQISSAREWREKFWHSRTDCFDAFIMDNKIQFKTCGSIPIDLLQPWIETHKVSCDIANIQDDFEYWSFSSYKNGILVKHEDTLDEILLKVLMMVEEEKPKAQTFKRIYKDCYDKNIPKELLNTYLSGETYAFTA